MMLRPPLVVTTLLLGCAHAASPEPTPTPEVDLAGPTPQGSGNVEVQTPNHRIAVSAQPSAEVCRDDPRVRSCRVHMTSSDPLPLDLAAGHGAIALLYAEVMPSDLGQGTWRTPDHFNHSPAVCDGVDTLVLLAGYTGSTGRSKSLDLVRVDARGRITSEPITVYADPERLAYEPTMLRDDDALFIAWATHGEPRRIALKRIDLGATAGPSTSGPAIAR